MYLDHEALANSQAVGTVKDPTSGDEVLNPLSKPDRLSVKGGGAQLQSSKTALYVGSM